VVVLLLVLTVLLVKTCSRAGKHTCLPEAAYPQSCHPSLQIIKHSAFHLAYHEEHKQAAWVIYLLTRKRVQNKVVKRRNNFRVDPLVRSGSASPDDYRGSGYDRGHLVPAADMRWSAQAMDETFYMSNISPQKRKFNSGIWLRLEERVRYWAEREDSILVVTGAVLHDNPAKKIGKNKVSVPRHFYKVVLDITGPEYKGIAFLISHEPAGNDIYDFAITIDSLEKFSCINFFASLKNLDIEQIESNLNIELWK